MPFIERNTGNRITGLFENAQHPGQEWLDDAAQEVLDFQASMEMPPETLPTVQEQLDALWEAVTPESDSNAATVKQRVQDAKTIKESKPNAQEEVQ